MAEKRKSIIDEAFMEAESIDKAFKANAKEILAQTMSSEIEEMVKESLKEDWNGLKEDEDDEEIEDLEFDDSDLASLDAGDDLDLDLGDDEEGDDLDFDLGDDEDEDVVVHDLTDANDEEVVNVFKKMSPEDEIEVVQDGNNIDIKDNATGAEYRIELGGGMSPETDEFDLSDLEDEDYEDEDYQDEDYEEDEDENEDYMSDMGEGVIYEIHLSEDEEGDKSGETKDDEEIGENVTRNYSNGRKQTLKPDNYPSKFKRPGVRNESTTPRVSGLINENKVLKETISSIKSENETLKEDYNKMVDALKEFRNKLNEVAVFNSNLTYTVRLFTEHSTTKDEKVDIIKRFDEAGSLKESKNIYKNLVKEISKTKAPIKESIENKINETKGSGSATQITESKVYVNPEFEKMKQLWSYDYKK